MIESIKRFFDRKIRQPSGVTAREATEQALKLATAALLIEATRADRSVKRREQEIVASAVRNTFGLSPEETEELIALAEEEVDQSVSFYQFTHLINDGFSLEQKKRLVELLWRVVFADREMEKHEEHLVRRIADLLYVPHKDFIRAKLKAKEEMNRGGG